MSPAQRARVSLMSPEEVRAQRARLERWRSFPHQLERAAVRWSPYARARARQLGWSALRRGVSDARPAGSIFGPPKTTLRVAVIRVDFSADRGGDGSTGNGRFDLSGPDTNQVPIDRPPHNRTFYQKHVEALTRYYEFASYGRVHVTGDVWPREENEAYHATDMADLGPWKFSRDVYPQALGMFRMFAAAADSQSMLRHDRIPWDAYDGILFIHAGSDLQSDVRQDSPEDIPTFHMTVADTDRVVLPVNPQDTTDHPQPLWHAVFLPETESQDGYYGALNGTIAHESGHHLFDFDDIYNVNTGFPVVGFWDLMDSGNLAGARVLLNDGSIIFATGLLPPSIDPFQRVMCTDTLALREVVDGDTTALLDSEHHPDMRRVKLTGDEYLVLENRLVPPDSMVQLQQDSITHVILGPKQPDSLSYDNLLPGSGILVWHIDESHIWFSEYPARIPDDYGVNTVPGQPGVSVVEADGLADLGDPGSPYLLGSYRDPWFVSNNATLSDTTHPNLIPNLGTRPHRRLDFLDDPGPTMHFVARRTWQLPGWPVRADLPVDGPRLLATDADGDGLPEVCWAGGDTASADSAALFAVRADGSRLDTTVAGYAFAHLDRMPRPVMAAIALNDPGTGTAPAVGPSWFAVSTYPAGPDTSSPGGRVWLVDHHGQALPGWPVVLPSIVTTPPVIFGVYPDAQVLVGCANGQVVAIGLDGRVQVGTPPLGAPIAGRLAVMSAGPGSVRVAAGAENGTVGIFELCPACVATGPAARTLAVRPLVRLPSHPPGTAVPVGASGFAPDFLWIPFDGATARTSTPTCGGGTTLMVHSGSQLWALCPDGALLWSRDAGDTLVDALGAGDPDGDGFPDVLTQTVHSALAFWNAGGYPRSGWPKRTTRETFITHSPPLALDVTGDGHTDVVALNSSGIVAALDGEGRTPAGWPLASGVGTWGDAVAADLNGDGRLDLVVPDRDSSLWAYTLPTSGGGPAASSWTVVGGDAGRSSWLRPGRTTVAPAPYAGPLLHGSLRVFPNPARRRPVAFAYTLTEPAQVEVRIFDTSGHQITELSGPGSYGIENRLVWDPGSAPAGLYMARLRFRGAAGEHTEVMPVGVLR